MALAKRIIPCLEIDRGRVVKGTQFADMQDAGDPVAIARRYDQQGADELVFMDIVAATEDRQPLLDAVQKVASEVFIPLTVGGGIKTLDDIHKLLAAGADKVSLNTAAIDQPELVAEAARRYGRQCLIVSLEARNVAPAGKAPHYELFTHRGQRATGLDAVAWARYMVELGAAEILLTNVDRDGTRAGFDIQLNRAIAEAVSTPVIVSGGVGHLDHLYEGLVTSGVDGVLVASVFHAGTYTIQQAKNYLTARGVAVRDPIL